jgi:hypothetical protein
MNSTTEIQIATLLADPLSAARSAADSGHRVIGYVGPDVPVELIIAAGAVPVRLSGKADTATAHADGFIERAFIPEIRSIAEQWVSGELDFIDSVVLPRSDDSAQRLYYYVCELQRRGSCRGPRPLIYDIAAVDRSSSAQHTIAATSELACEIGARERILAHAIKEVAEHTLVLQRIAAKQRSELSLRGSVALRLAKSLQFCWSAQFRLDLQSYFDGLFGSPVARRVLLVGNSAPDDRLHRAVEKGGASVVRELTDANWFADRSTPETAVASFEDIGVRAHARSSLSQRLARSADAILTAAQEANARGVVIWMIEEDSTLGWELPDQLTTLKRAGVPVLVLTRQTWAADSGTLQAIEHFCAGLGESR